jgi:catechol 1,2-dioxygenase
VTSKKLSRRSILSGSVALSLPLLPVLGCRSTATAAPGPAPGDGGGARVVPPTPSALGTTPVRCGLTATNIEGPYYRPNAPFTSSLAGSGVRGDALVLSGRVLSLDCKSVLDGAVLDVWHADGDGRYDNDGSFGAPNATPMRLRGKVRVDDRGCFAIRTVVPGRYLNGRQYRPSHIHVKVTANGHVPLTTQLYFPGDPYNEVDPFIDRSLIMAVEKNRGEREGRFDFVLRPL